MFRKLLDEGRAGENVGVLLRGTKRDEVERGQVLAQPGSITPHTKFEAEVYVLSKDEGGRHTPFFKGYRPQFYFRTTDVTGSCELPEGVEMVMPGDNVKLAVDLMPRSPWTKVCVLLFGKVAGPWARGRREDHRVSLDLRRVVRRHSTRVRFPAARGVFVRGLGPGS